MHIYSNVWAQSSLVSSCSDPMRSVLFASCAPLDHCNRYHVHSEFLQRKKVIQLSQVTAS